MEHDKSSDGLIRASMAKRILALNKQYDALNLSAPKYDATLSVISLQFLLTSCFEMNRERRDGHLKTVMSKVLTDVPDLCGLGRHMVKEFFPGEERPTFEVVIGHLRNSVSHPLYPADEAVCVDSKMLPVTGFYQVVRGSKITAIGFVHSPDIIKSKDGSLRNKNRIVQSGNVDQFDENVKKRDPCFFGDRSRNDICREVRQQIRKIEFSEEGKRVVEFSWNDKVFMPVFRMEIPVDRLKILVEELSELISCELNDSNDYILNAQEA